MSWPLAWHLSTRTYVVLMRPYNYKLMLRLGEAGNNVTYLVVKYPA